MKKVKIITKQELSDLMIIRALKEFKKKELKNKKNKKIIWPQKNKKEQ